MIKKIILMLLPLVCLTENSWAARGEDSSNPTGCRDVGYQFDLKTLQFLPEKAGARQSMYFIYNKRGETVNLYQMRGNEGTRSLYLNHVISQKQWGVLSTNEKKLKFICTVNDPAFHYGRIVDCADSLQVCEYTNVKYGLNNKGNYWLVNSNTKNEAVRSVVRYGIIPAV